MSNSIIHFDPTSQRLVGENRTGDQIWFDPMDGYYYVDGDEGEQTCYGSLAAAQRSYDPDKLDCPMPDPGEVYRVIDTVTMKGILV